jgi:hypothetical protein
MIPDVSDSSLPARSVTIPTDRPSKHHFTLLYLQLHTHTMIRRKVSTGILRATKAAPTSNAAQAVSGSPMQQQSANLASAVLLNSQRNWKGETVVALKGELKKRGLSQTGNK